MTDFGHWLNKTAKEQQERYRREEREEKAKALRVRPVEDSKLRVEEVSLSDNSDDEQLSDYMKRFYAAHDKVMKSQNGGSWDDILETKNNNLEQYDIMQMDTDCDTSLGVREYSEIITDESVQSYIDGVMVCERFHNTIGCILKVKDDADLGYGEHYL